MLTSFKFVIIAATSGVAGFTTLPAAKPATQTYAPHVAPLPTLECKSADDKIFLEALPKGKMQNRAVTDYELQGRCNDSLNGASASLD
jgi:hypothetical protein